MSTDVRSTALRLAARAARNGHGITLYSNGPELVLVLGGRQVVTRRVHSAGLARAVVDRYVRDLDVFPHLSPVDALDASIAYAESAWVVACRRAGRRVA